MKITTFFVISVIGLGACTSPDPTGKTVAKVNNRGIPLSALEKKIGRMSQIPGKDFSSNKVKRDLLEEMVNEELLYQAAVKERVAENSERIRREMAREYLNTKIGQERYEPTESEIKDLYEKKKNELDRIRASHILIKPEKPGDAASEAAAKAKAQGLLAKLKGKADFAKLARDFSQDASNKDRGGDLSYFSRDKMVPEFSDAAFALKKVGDLSGVVKTQYGYHIIKLTGEQRGLDFYRHSLKWQIAQDKQREKADKLFSDLRRKASVKIFDDIIGQATAPTPSATPAESPAAPAN